MSLPDIELAKPGDQWVWSTTIENECDTEPFYWWCCREVDHTGPHVAGEGSFVLGVWTSKDDFVGDIPPYPNV